jgi:hypothetical protein
MTIEYPEHIKLHAVRDKSQAIGEFLEWLNSKGIVLCCKEEKGDGFCMTNTTNNEYLAEFLEINLEILEKEKTIMLEKIRKFEENQ